MAGHQLGVIIPALNEGTTIAAIVAAAGRYGVVIVVNDGSADDTAEQAQSAGAEVMSRPLKPVFKKPKNEASMPQ